MLKRIVYVRVVDLATSKEGRALQEQGLRRSKRNGNLLTIELRHAVLLLTASPI
jgi:hypothetical protein